MSKKFKNTVAITGSKSLLKAFEEELIYLGYEISKQSRYQTERTIVNNWNGNINLFSYAIGGHSRIQSAEYKFNLPEDWNKALAIVSEEEIPEYVEIIVNNGCFKKGEILKTKTYSNGGWKFVWPDGSGQVYSEFYKDYYKPSTKEAYEKQFKLKPEVGKWYTLKHLPKSIFYCTSVNERGILYGYGFDSFGNWMENLVDDGVNCVCNDIAFINARLATYEEVKKALSEEAVKRGFVKGVSLVKSGFNKLFSLSSPISGEFSWFEAFNVLECSNGQGHIFNNGKWAEIKKEIVINGYLVTKVNKDVVKVGCKNFVIEDLIKLKSFLNRYNGVYTIYDESFTSAHVDEVIQAFEKM